MRLDQVLKVAKRNKTHYYIFLFLFLEVNTIKLIKGYNCKYCKYNVSICIDLYIHTSMVYL